MYIHIIVVIISVSVEELVLRLCIFIFYFYLDFGHFFLEIIISSKNIYSALSNMKQYCSNLHFQ